MGLTLGPKQIDVTEMASLYEGSSGIPLIGAPIALRGLIPKGIGTLGSWLVVPLKLTIRPDWGGAGLKQIYFSAPVVYSTNVYKLHHSNQLYIMTWNHCSSFWYQNPCIDLFPRPRLPPLVCSVALLPFVRPISTSGKSSIFGVLLGTWSAVLSLRKNSARGGSTIALCLCWWMQKAMFWGMRQKGKGAKRLTKKKTYRINARFRRN